MASRHARLVETQFGPRAAAYVESAVHAQGADLDEAAALLRDHAHARLLDLGCGGGHVSFTLAPLVREVIAYDLSAEMLAAVMHAADQRGLANIAPQQGTVEELPFESGRFDVIVSRYSAHHWSGFARALAEAYRVLRPGGLALFIDAISPGIGLFDTYLQSVELLRDPSHVRDYAAEEWKDALAAAGFAVGRVTKRRVRLEFQSWVERMATPQTHIDAIRSLQMKMTSDVAKHFDIESDGSFTIDAATIEARRR